MTMRYNETVQCSKIIPFSVLSISCLKHTHTKLWYEQSIGQQSENIFSRQIKLLHTYHITDIILWKPT